MRQVPSCSPELGSAGCNGGVFVDQALFTSIPSRTGSGYRIVAASSGIGPEERQEITQRCPSHASLADEGPSAEALYAWSFRTGRYAVAWSRHAGLEHTARGGYRVCTRVAVLDTPGYERFEFHPLRVYSAMLETLEEEPAFKEHTTLGTLLLPDPVCGLSTWTSALGIGCNRTAIFTILDSVMAGGSTIITGLGSPLAVLDALLAVVPLSLRPAISVSAGLRYSPARPARITVLDGDCDEAQRLTRGQKITWLDAASLDASAADHDASVSQKSWPALVRRWWADGHRRDLCRLAARMSFEATPAALERIVALCEDTDKAIGADPATAEELAARYSAFQAANPLEDDLVKRLHSVLLSCTPQ